jgi:peptide chain release factor 2
VITFDVATSRDELEKLRNETSAPGFWDDQERARKTMALISRLDGDVSLFDRIMGHISDGHLSCEKGVHRLVRISPFDFSKRRHTSFVSLDVIPEVDEELDIEIDPKELRIDTYRSSGAGGQHVNVTDSAVRITHIPTGITVQCQNERSQISNRATAMKILKSRLFELARREKVKEIQALRGKRVDIAWGNQIRSYVFAPYQLVKDHRTGVETGNVQAVMDGEIDQYMQECLRWRKKQEGEGGEGG